VGQLGDALELLHDAQPRWNTLRATGRQWRNQPLANEVWERHFAAVQSGNPARSVVQLSGYAPDGPQTPVPDESEDGWRLWMEQGGRVRSERAMGDEPLTVVFDGPTWWSWSPRLGGMTNSGAQYHQHGFGPAEALIDTSALLHTLRLHFLGADTLRGRNVLRLRGVPRAQTAYEPVDGLHELGIGADDYVLSVDAERGVILRAEARLREQPFIVIEMTEVAFDVDLPEETFTIELPAGQRFEDVSKGGNARWRRRRRLFAPGWRRRRFLSRRQT
jgi:outer membrane lipoprotein-sorting protein